MSAERVLVGFDYFARYTAGLAAGLRANGWATALAYHDHDHAFGQAPGGLARFLADAVPGDVPRFPIERRVRDPRGWGSAVRALRGMRAWRPDLVHVQACVTSDPRLMMALPLRRDGFAMTVHDVSTHPGDRQPHRYKLVAFRWLLDNAGVIFVHADVLRETLERRARVPRPIVVVPHGVEHDDLGPLPTRRRLLMFGRISEYKGIDVLLEAMPAVWERAPDVELTIAGEGRLDPHPLLEDPRVELIHRHVADEEVPQLFTRASLVVLPYVEASQSGVGSLAKGYGRPLLASSVGGLVELVADGSGELVPPRDPAQLAERVVALLDDRARLERLAAAGRRSVEETSGWPAVGAATIAAYERHLLGRSRQVA